MAKLRVPMFRVAYCKLWKPDVDGNYGLTAIWDTTKFSKDEKVYFKALIDEVESLIKDKFAKTQKDLTVKQWLAGKRPGGYVVPFKRGGSEGCEADQNTEWLQQEAMDGMVIASLKSSKRRVGVLDTDKTLLDPAVDADTEKVYSGCYGAAFVTPFYFNKEKNQGISLSLQSFMKVKDGEPLAGGSNAEEDFAEVDVEKEYGVDNKVELGI